MTSSAVPGRDAGLDPAGSDGVPAPTAPLDDAASDAASDAAGTGSGAAGGEPGPAPRTDPAAVTAVVLGALALVPLALAAAIAGLVRTRGGRRRGRALAVTSLVLCGVWTVAGAGTAAAVLARPHRPPAPRHPLRGTVFTLRTGQCADIGHGGVTGARVVPCAQPHDTEIYATFRVTGRRWPGAAALAVQANSGCLSRLGGYLNPQLAANLTETYVYPDQGAWQFGERTVVCEIRNPAGPMTGSVRRLGG